MRKPLATVLATVITVGMSVVLSKLFHWDLNTVLLVFILAGVIELKNK